MVSKASPAPRPLPSILLFSLVPIAAWFVVRPFLDPVPALPTLWVSFGFSIFALLATLYLIPALGPTFVRANLKGPDLLKTYQTPMFVSHHRWLVRFIVKELDSPDGLGLVCASIYILLLMLFIPFPFSNTLTSVPTFHLHRQRKQYEGINVVEFPHHQVDRQCTLNKLPAWLSTGKLSVYLSSLLSLLVATMLGFLDDVFDIRWRHKVPIPIIASIPLLMVYYADHGNTQVVVPIPFRPIFGTLVNMGE
jgi:UDP-N-acetylglucosamine--dolichyl-phosphate N-acetylglucosaminephosphotransferase